MESPVTAQVESPIPTERAGGNVPLNRVVVFVLLAIGGGIADLWTKHVVFAWRGLPQQSDVWWLVEGYVGIETAVNIGAVFGIGAGQGTIFAALSIIAAIGIVTWLFYFGAANQWWLTIAMGCVMGGIIGNLYDRLGLWWQPGYPEPWKSGVRDWILWQLSDDYRWPNFNIADSLLVCGAGMLLWQSFFPPVDPTQSEASDADTNASETQPK
jgi:signal peptidase II